MLLEIKPHVLIVLTQWPNYLIPAVLNFATRCPLSQRTLLEWWGDLSIILPRDDTERARPIMQFVERRMTRGRPVTCRVRLFSGFLGPDATGGFRPVLHMGATKSIQRACPGLPKTPFRRQPTEAEFGEITSPYIYIGWAHAVVDSCRPDIVICDFHPTIAAIAPHLLGRLARLILDRPNVGRFEF